MQIWVDADACPKAIKDILYRAAIRTNTPLLLVANQPLQIPRSPLIKSIQVSAGFDVADNYIVAHLTSSDLVITADIPLASATVEKGGFALNPRGELYNQHNIKQHRAIRDLHTELRGIGMLSGGSAGLSKTEIRNFANALDKMLAKNR